MSAFVQCNRCQRCIGATDYRNAKTGARGALCKCGGVFVLTSAAMFPTRVATPEVPDHSGLAVLRGDHEAIALRRKVPIVGVVREHIALREDGTRFVGTCPFCRGECFHVSDVVSLFWCEPCGLSGDVIAFVERIAKCTRAEAMRILSAR